MSPVMSVALLSLTLFFDGNVASASPAAGSRLILLSIDDKAEEPDNAVELNATNFESVLTDTPATHAIVEFFAHWCPACRNYKPEYEMVAKIFNGADAVHPGIILLTKVDCALEINVKLCDKFSVARYPTLFWGQTSKFVSRKWDPKQEKSEIRLIDEWRTADILLNWINQQLSSSYRMDDEKFENDQPQKNPSDIDQVARSIYDIEEATATAFDIILNKKMIKPQTRASLVLFLQLLVAHHPSKRCRKGTAEILTDIDEISQKEVESGGQKEALKNYQICGKEVPRGYWVFCGGSKNETRGLSCGLWLLLHSLSVRVDDGEGQVAFTTICDFIHNFFICEECRQHFHSMCSSVSTPFKRARDLSIWLWDAHNNLNRRLIKEEANLGTGHPQFPKPIWPPKQLCPSCRKKSKESGPSDWNLDEVHRFLVQYYGKALLTLEKVAGSKDPAASVAAQAVVVPVGATLAMAAAIGGFGALSCCYWWQQQKSRRYKHLLHPLKKI